ncbi:hypothetical protein AGMMS50212_13480 [Spirochaetia bacterium]|nr:hypothetical protein AGMMS50212_13480 [Spirochaetia bacterium]
MSNEELKELIGLMDKLGYRVIYFNDNTALDKSGGKGDYDIGLVRK